MAKKDNPVSLKLIFNPSAGNSPDPELDLNAVCRCLEANGFEVSMARAKPKEKATPLAHKASKDGYEVVAAMGGDGTVEAVMRGLTGSRTRLGIIPTGVQNHIARSLGIPLDLEQACRLIATGQSRSMDVAQVKRGKAEWYPFFEMVGMGYKAAAAPLQGEGEKADDELFRTQIIPPERRQGIPTVLLNLDDGRIMEVETSLVTVSTAPIFGKKFFVPPPEFLQDGALDISLFQGSTEADLYDYYGKMRTGRYAGDGNVQHLQSRTLKLRSFPPMHVLADGVDLGQGTVSVRLRLEALQVIAPQTSRDLLGLPRGAYDRPAHEPALDASHGGSPA